MPSTELPQFGPLRRNAALLLIGASTLCGVGAMPPPFSPPPEATRPVPPVEVMETPNLLPNPSFERSVGDRVPEYWGRFGSYVPSCPDWTVVRVGAYHGDSCLRAVPGQELRIPTETIGLPADDYVFSVYLKGAGQAVNGELLRCEMSLWARPDVDDGKSPPQTWTQMVDVTPDWQRHTLAVQINRHLDFNRWGIAGGLFACGIKPLNGVVLVDAAQLEQTLVPAPFSTRGPMVRPVPPPAPAADELQLVCEALQPPPARAESAGRPRPAQGQQSPWASGGSSPCLGRSAAVAGGAVRCRSGAFTQSWGDEVANTEWRYADASVPPEHAGKLWSVVIAASGQFYMDMQGIPPFVALSPDSHFLPTTE